MQNFVSFWSDLFQIVCDFLLSEPIIWFVGVIVLILVTGFLQKLVHIK